MSKDPSPSSSPSPTHSPSPTPSPSDRGSELLPSETTDHSRVNLLPAEPPRTPSTLDSTGDSPRLEGLQCDADPLPRQQQHRQHPHQEQQQQVLGERSNPFCSHHHHRCRHHRCRHRCRHRSGGVVSRVGHPMKRLLTWVKTFLQGARARLLWSRRCARCQFSFVPISESSNNDVSSSRSFLVSENVDDCVSSDVTVEDCCHEHHGEGQCCHERDVAECCCDHVEGEDFHEENRKELRHGRVSGGGEEERDRLVSDEGEEDEEEGVEESSRKGSRTRRKLDSVLRTCRRRMSRVTAVSLLWSLLSLLVAGACAFSFYHPNWITHPDRLHSFGLFTQCVRDPQSPHPRAVCVGYGAEGRVDLGSIPAGAWQASTLLFGAGAGLQCVGAVVTFMLLLQPAHPYGGGGHRVALLCGYMQTLAVLLLVSGLVMFPLGFSTSFFSYYCDSSGAFCVGHCRMGWSYVLAITATALAIFCPVLSNYTDVTFDKDGREEREAERDLVTDV